MRHQTRITTKTTTAAAALALLATGCAGTREDARTAQDISQEVRSAPRSTAPAPTGEAEEGGIAETRRVATAATELLSSLPGPLREEISYETTDPSLREWIYFPTTDDRNGVPLADLDATQRDSALGLAEEVLSPTGYDQMVAVLAAEDELGRRNNEPEVNSGAYHVAIYGEPSPREQFTVQITGHHLAINHTYRAGLTSPTPAFVGTDPVDFELDGRRVRPMLPKTEAVARTLESLTSDQLDAARVDDLGDVLVGNGPSTGYPDPQGVLVGDLSRPQRQTVVDVVRAWVGDTDPRLAEELVSRYAADFDQTRLAWSRSLDPDTPGTYLRLDGPELWIEFSNVGRFGNGDNHYHSVYRDRELDYLG